MTEVDSINSKKIFLMSYEEFVEAMCRVAEDFAPYPVYYDPDKKGKWNYDKRKLDYKLNTKVEGMCKILIKKCCDK